MPDRDTTINDEIRKALQGARPQRKTADVAESIGVTYHRLSNIANGKVAPSQKEIDDLRAELNLPAHWPSSPPHLDGARKGEIVSLAGVPLVEIPVVGSVSAGGGIWNVDTDRRMVKVPASLAAMGSIGFIVDGDSMMTLLEEHDTAVFREARRARNGFIYLVKTPDEGFVVKRLQYDRGDWLMSSLNPKYARKQYPDGAEVIGLLVGYYRVNGRREKTESDADGLLPD